MHYRSKAQYWHGTSYKVLHYTGAVSQPEGKVDKGTWPESEMKCSTGVLYNVM